MSHPPLYFGPFELGEPVQSGGMAIIHHAVHRQSGERVAIKIIRPDQLGNASHRRALRKEISTIADLDHPNIVRIFDIGEISEQTAALAPEVLPAGAPWYAMEYVDGGSLLDAPSCPDWATARGQLLELLDALAHAHAAGVVHRDLKPGNVLLASDPQGGPPHIKLVDFGIAQLVENHGELGELTSEHQVSGTPRYMAPEQIAGRHREQGPWTDLYALGCLAWFLLTGLPPYSGHMLYVMRSHLQDPLPTFVPQFLTPPGVLEWLEKLLQKAPHKRFRRAADAARALLQIPAYPAPPALSLEDDEPTGELDLSLLHTLQRGDPWLPTLSFLHTSVAHQTQATRPVERIEEPYYEELDIFFDEGPATMMIEPEDVIAEPALDNLARLPASWERLDPAQERSRTGASLGLFGLRTPPLVGRIIERDMLWAELRKVLGFSQTRAVFIHGAQGSGKSRLTQWLARRADEVGACITLGARHDAEQHEDHDGARQMLTTAFRCAGLAHDALRRHLRRVLIEDPRYDLSLSAMETLAIWLSEPTLAAEEGITPETLIALERIRDPHQRYPHIFTLLERMSRERALLLTFDDAHHSTETLHFILALLQHTITRPELPIFVVATLDVEALARRESTPPLLAHLLDEAAPHNRPEPRATSLDLLPLPPRDHRAFIEAMLPLAPPLADELARRTEGRPGFAFEIAADWVQRALLVESRHGLTLVERATIELPTTMHELWRERLAQLLHELPHTHHAEIQTALEIASTLGRRVSPHEWLATCRLRGVEPSDQLVDLMITRQLAQIEPDGWSLAHPLLQEVLQEQAERRGELMAHHAACATMLQRQADARPEHVLRLAFHLSRAGLFEEAIRHYAECARIFRLSGEYSRSLDARARQIELLELIEPHHHSERWCMATLDSIELLLHLQRLEAAREQLARFDLLFPEIEEAPRTQVRSRHETLRLDLRLTEGALQETMQARDAILHACQNFPDDQDLSASLLLIAQAHLLSGELYLARHLYEIAQARHAAHANKNGYATASYGLARCALLRDDYERAARQLVRARALFREGRVRAAELSCAHSEVTLLRLQGKREDARRLSEQLEQFFAQLDPPLRARHALHDLVIALEDGELERAQSRIAALEPMKDALGFVDAITYQMARALHLATQRQVSEADMQLALARRGVQATGLCTVELATLSELLGHMSRDLDPELSRQSAAFARQLLDKLGSRSRLSSPSRARTPRRKLPPS